MATVASVNIGSPRPSGRVWPRTTGIHKQPTTDPVQVQAPPGRGHGGLAGDYISDSRHHGGPDQAVYAYAMEDLEAWSAELSRPLLPGSFGENLTTSGLDVTGATIGQHWRIGDSLLLEVSLPRIPCQTFANALDIDGWVKTFTARVKPGTYLRVLEPGAVRRGDPIIVVHTPDHDVSVQLAFRALTTERELLPRLLAADALPEEHRRKARAAS